MPLVIHHNKGIYFTSKPINPFEGDNISELDNLAKVYDDLKNALCEIHRKYPELSTYCFSPFETLLDSYKLAFIQIDEINRLEDTSHHV